MSADDATSSASPMTAHSPEPSNPTSVRDIGQLLLALLGVVISTLAAFVLVGFLQRSALLANILMLLGWLGVSLTRSVTHPFRAIRIVAGYCAISALVLLYGSTLPPSSGGVNSIFWLVFATLAVGVLWDPAHVRHHTRWCTALLVFAGIVDVVRAFQAVTGALDQSGPSTTLAYLLATSAGIAAISLAWHARHALTFRIANNRETTKTRPAAALARVALPPAAEKTRNHKDKKRKTRSRKR